MKLKLLLISGFGLMLAACSGPDPKVDESHKQEIIAYDSIAFENEKVALEIQESIVKLDSLINEL